MSRRVGMSDDEWAAFKDNYASDQRLGVREYIAPPKVLRRHHCFGEKSEMKSFSDNEAMASLLSAAESSPHPDVFVRIGRHYLYRMGNRDEAVRWLKRAANYEHPDALALLRKIQRGCGSERVCAVSDQKQPNPYSTLPRMKYFRVVDVQMADGNVQYLIFADIGNQEGLQHVGTILRRYGKSKCDFYLTRQAAFDAAVEMKRLWGRA